MGCILFIYAANKRLRTVTAVYIGIQSIIIRHIGLQLYI